jgi:hypothetical protein
MLMFDSSVQALKNLVQAESGAQIVKISPRGYKLTNGLDFCTVDIKSKEGIDYLLQAYGNEAVKLHKEASTIHSEL